MEFDKLKRAVREIPLDTVRTESGNYLEVVVVRDHLTDIILKLDSIFGSSVWTVESGRDIPGQVQKTIDKFGGIHEGQTLYFWLQDNSVIFTMVWPWQDGYHITLKIAQEDICLK